MEKMVYVLWRDAQEAEAAFNTRLLQELSAELLNLGAARLSINVVDEAVAAGAGLRQQNTRPAPSGMVSFFLNSAHVRGPCEAALQRAAPRIAGYEVSEATALPNTTVVEDGARTHGFSQVALLTRPPRLTYEGWLEIWMRDQTRVAVETQSTFFYCQNIVNRSLTYGAPGWDAIVMEGFPLEAMTDPLVYFDAAGDPARQKENADRMMANVHRFIDFDKIDVLITSEYRFGGWADLDRGKIDVRE